MLIEFDTFGSRRRKQFGEGDYGFDASNLVTDMGYDFALTVGGDTSMVLDYGGVPYGDPEVAGYAGLADYIRSGGSPDAYVASVNQNSMSDILRSGGDSPGFDPAVFNSNGAGVVKDWNITSVLDSITKGIGTIGGVALGAIGLSRSQQGSGSAGSAGTGNRAQPGANQPSLAQKIFGGLLPGPSGNLPQTLMIGALIAVGGYLVYTLARR